MKKTWASIRGVRLPVHSLNTLIIGSGAAALNAALRLHDLGLADIAVATDRWGGGTSNNAGSDKQTYYKLSLAGELPDSAFRMAVDLFSGGSMHGDIALAEAQNSARAFYHLVEMGVPFPHDAYGAYVGYKTDHDPRQRATSAGPLTSRLMFEALAGEVERRRIAVFDRHQVIALLTRGHGADRSVIGALALDLDRLDRAGGGFVLFNTVNIILGTGGPAGIYGASVYPESQLGSHGLAFEVGAAGQNLTESQFGLASIKFRWNLSGTYQQVIPRYFSTDAAGHDAREFLSDFFPDMGKLATAIFLKGYQWPFDAAKVADFGSSLIDLLVFQETVGRGRRVFLDYRRNPDGAGRLEDFSFKRLSGEALSYLHRSGALHQTPIERLARMNPPAIDLYRGHGIDLAAEPLEIALCAQHNNGGLKGDIWWESNIAHLFPVGEANGSHGVRRPGGSALNSGQVGGLRAALYIARRYGGRPPSPSAFLARARGQAGRKIDLARRLADPKSKDKTQVFKLRTEIQDRMSACGAAVRSEASARKAVKEAWDLCGRLESEMRVPTAKLLPEAFRNLDLGLTHALYLEAIREYLEQGGKSRGSYLVLDPEGAEPCPGLGESWRFSLNPRGAFVDQKILEISLDENGRVIKQWVEVRPMPGVDAWFEDVWRDYREDRVVRKEGS
ncbi:MAG: oxidoreductase [Candidatus Aminicenantes bacterium RBG_16_63_16]|nr:MAG: oxidoreductase [Candidatus Aminicenantes bacterium RBG_16_63_16]